MAARKIPDLRVPLAIWRAVAQKDPTVLDHHADHDRLSHRQIVDPHRETHDLRSECPHEHWRRSERLILTAFRRSFLHGASYSSLLVVGRGTALLGQLFESLATRGAYLYVCHPLSQAGGRIHVHLDETAEES